MPESESKPTRKRASRKTAANTKSVSVEDRLAALEQSNKLLQDDLRQANERNVTLQAQLSAVRSPVVQPAAPTPGTPAQPAQVTHPRKPPTGLPECRYMDEAGKEHRAWIEKQRTIEIVEGAGKNARKNEVTVADLTIETRPGKYNSIEGVPNFDCRLQCFNTARWCSMDQVEALKAYQAVMDRQKKLLSAPAVPAVPVIATEAGKEQAAEDDAADTQDDGGDLGLQG